MINLKEGTYVAPGICVYDNVLQDPQKFIDLALKTCEWRDAKVHDSGHPEDVKLKSDVRNNRVAQLQVGFDQPIEWFELGSLIFQYMNRYAKENEFAYGGLEPMGMLHYKAGEGFYIPHVDHNDLAPRVAAALLYLNDVEEGGETHFVNFDIAVKPKAGTLVLFPGNYPYLHGAKTPISNDKFVVVTWFPPITDRSIMINLNKIVIVGGGSAGWMSAATMVRAFPDKEVIVIESPDYPIIGVGESTLGGITGWANWIGIDEKDFMPATDAVYKMSIKFTDFYKKDAGGFHYPFGKVFTDGTVNGLNDWYVKKAKFPDLDVADYARTFYPALTLAEQNKLSWNESGKLGNFNFKQDVAYHFDATKFGQWLKNNYCIPRGVTVIPQTVETVNTNEAGIESLVLTDGTLITADLFIDCTGFKSMLLEGALEEPWNDFGHMLPNNSAWATRIPYTDKEKEMEPYTNCTAINNGWVWNIPSWERIGTGYVFSDNHVSKEEALEEFKQHLKSDKMTIHNPDRDVEALEFKYIKFRIGIHRRTFVKNVVGIGFAAGFIEPLESNGLFTVHEFLDKLVKTLSRGTVTQWDRDAYNHATRRQYLGFKEFVAQHYALSNRTDTQYWRDVTNKTFQPEVPALDPSMIVGFNDLADIHINRQRYDGVGGIHCIATGLNYLPVTKDTVEKWHHYDGIDYYEYCKDTWKTWDIFRKLWQEEADNSPTMYQWLKDNIHNDKA